MQYLCFEDAEFRKARIQLALNELRIKNLNGGNFFTLGIFCHTITSQFY